MSRYQAVISLAVYFSSDNGHEADQQAEAIAHEIIQATKAWNDPNLEVEFHSTTGAYRA